VLRVADRALEELCSGRGPESQCSLLPLGPELEKSPIEAGGGPSLLSPLAAVGLSPVNRKMGVLHGDRGSLGRADGYRVLGKELLHGTDPGLAEAVTSVEHVLVELLVKGWIWVIGTALAGSHSSEHS